MEAGGDALRPAHAEVQLAGCVVVQLQQRSLAAVSVGAGDGPHHGSEGRVKKNHKKCGIFHTNGRGGGGCQNRPIFHFFSFQMV